MNEGFGWGYICELYGMGEPFLKANNDLSSTGYFMGLFIGPVIAGNIAERYAVLKSRTSTAK